MGTVVVVLMLPIALSVMAGGLAAAPTSPPLVLSLVLLQAPTATSAANAVIAVIALVCIFSPSGSRGTSGAVAVRGKKRDCPDAAVR
jgi:hypothetical protein